MKIDLTTISTDKEGFMIHPHDLNGETVYLVQPQHIGTKFSRNTMIFRSSVWSRDGNPVSLGLPKFFNAGEQPDLYPNWEKAKDGISIEKMDGTCLLISKYKGNLVIRTRGTTDATTLDNGFEIDILKKKYPKFFDNELLNSEKVTLVAEWFSPLNIICLRYGEEPRLWMTAIIRHDDYSLYSQKDLDVLAKELEIDRPRTFKFSNLKEMVETVTAFKGIEGICFYFNDGQNIVKLKGALYLKIHKMKSELGSLDKIIDLFFEVNPDASYNEFFSYIETTFDYELANQCIGQISKIVEGMREVRKIEAGMKAFIKNLQDEQLKARIPFQAARKDAAMKILSAYGETNRGKFLFQLLDGKELDREALKKLLYQVLKV